MLVERSTMDAFVTALRSVQELPWLSSLNGKLAVLMGDGTRTENTSPHHFGAERCEAEGYGSLLPKSSASDMEATSSSKVYTTAFIPRLHDVCLVLEQPPRTGCEMKPLMMKSRRRGARL